MMRLPKVSRGYFTLNLKLDLFIFQSFTMLTSPKMTTCLFTVWFFFFKSLTSVWWVSKQFCEYDTGFDIAQACCALGVPNTALSKKLHWPSMIQDLDHIMHFPSSSHLTSLGQNYQHIWNCTLSQCCFEQNITHAITIFTFYISGARSLSYLTKVFMIKPSSFPSCTFFISRNKALYINATKFCMVQI